MADTFDYVAMQATADRLIKKFGATAAIRRLAKTGGTEWEPTQTPTDYATAAVVTNLPRWYSAFADDNSDVLRTDRLGYVAMGPLAALGVTEILPNDILVFGAKVFAIIDAKPIAPAGFAATYILQLRI